MDMFVVALRLKAAMVAVDQDFEFVVYELGTSMTNDRDAALEETHSSNHGTQWKLASIHTYRSEASSPRNALEDAVVKTRNMVSKNKEQRTQLSLHTKILSTPKSSEDSAHKKSTPRFQSVTSESSGGEGEDDDDDSEGDGARGNHRKESYNSKPSDHCCGTCGKAFMTAKGRREHVRNGKLSTIR